MNTRRRVFIKNDQIDKKLHRYLSILCIQQALYLYQKCIELIRTGYNISIMLLKRKYIIYSKIVVE